MKNVLLAVPVDNFYVDVYSIVVVICKMVFNLYYGVFDRGFSKNDNIETNDISKMRGRFIDTRWF